MPNTTCLVHIAPHDPVPFIESGNINFKAHIVGWIVCGFFSSVATVASLWLVWKHATYYTCPQQQRHIIRMLLMVPIYAIISTLSYIFYTEAIYFATIRDCYEAVVITSFFYLLLQYVGDTPAEQHEVFRQVKLKKWFWPLGFWKYRPDGLHFLWLMKIGILQYAIFQPVCTLVAVGLQYYGLYCLESWQPYFGHIWLSLVISISISIAMYNIIQIYLPITKELKPYKPVLKFLAIKCIVFLTFWQDSFLSVLIYLKAIKETKYFTTADIQVGLSALLVTFEMMVFAFVHIKAFTYIIYRPQDRKRTTKRGKALLDVIDFRDWWYEMKNTTRYVEARSRGRDYTIVDDIRWQKYMHLEKALGRDRRKHMLNEQEKSKKGQLKTYWVDRHDGIINESDQLINKNDEKIDTTDQKGTVEEGARVEQDLLAAGHNIDELYSAAEQGDTRDPRFSLLPFMSYNRPTLSRDLHPELAQYHRGVEEADPQGNKPPQRPEREASIGVARWWKSLRGNNFGTEGEVEAQEKTSMLDDEKIEDLCIIDSNNTRPETSHLSVNVLPNFESPLELIAKGNRNLDGSGSPAFLKTHSSSLVRQAKPNRKNSQVTRQRSEKAEITEKPWQDNDTRMTVLLDDIRPSTAEVTLSKQIARSINPSICPTTSSMGASNAPKRITPMTSLGPKGKSIAIELPPLLSNQSVPFIPPKRGPAVSMKTSRTSRRNIAETLIIEERVRTKLKEDDPEAEPISRAGYVVPGGQSYSQSVAKDEGKRQTERSQSKLNNDLKSSRRTMTNEYGQGRLLHDSTLVARCRVDTSNTNVIAPTQSIAQSHFSNTKMQEQETMLPNVPSASDSHIPLPAPSQMAHIGNRQDPFAAAVYANLPTTKSGSRISSTYYTANDTQGRAAHSQQRPRNSIEVGSILTHQDIVNVRTPSQPLPFHHAPNMIGSRHVQAYPVQSLPLHTRPRHSTGSIPRQTTTVSYHRYTGQPLWLQHSNEQRVPSRVERGRRQFEAPPGYHFDYID